MSSWNMWWKSEHTVHQLRCRNIYTFNIPWKTCITCPSGYYSGVGASSCTACGSNQNSYPKKPLPSKYNLISYDGLQSTCECSPSFTGSNCQTKACQSLLPHGSSLSILFNAVDEFNYLYSSLTSDPLNQNYINDGKAFLLQFLNNRLQWR